MEEEVEVLAHRKIVLKVLPSGAYYIPSIQHSCTCDIGEDHFQDGTPTATILEGGE